MDVNVCHRSAAAKIQLARAHSNARLLATQIAKNLQGELTAINALEATGHNCSVFKLSQ